MNTLSKFTIFYLFFFYYSSPSPLNAIVYTLFEKLVLVPFGHWDFFPNLQWVHVCTFILTCITVQSVTCLQFGLKCWSWNTLPAFHVKEDFIKQYWAFATLLSWSEIM